MKNKRSLPISCLLNGWKYILLRQIEFQTKIIGKEMCMPDGHAYIVFRHMHKVHSDTNKANAIFIVHFKFNKFNDRINRILSCIPIPMIAGFPGFCDKVWMHDVNSGFWYGLYAWEDEDAIEDYKKSFVLRLMIHRADKKSIHMEQICNCTLDNFIKTR